MSPSATLLRYLAKQFTVSFLAAIGVLLTIIYLVDSVELIRRAANRPDISFGQLAEMTLLHLPQLGQQLFQFAILAGALFTFWRLTRSSELVVLRAVGVSAWQFLFPIMLAAAMIGVFKITIINHFGSFLSARFEQMDNTLLRGRTSAIDVLAGGLWLRQNGPDSSYTIIHARNVDTSTWRLRDLSIFFMNGNDQLTGRLDAEDAALTGSNWEVHNGWMNQPNEPKTFVPARSIPTDITPEKIEGSFRSPSSLSFWDIPHAIATMEATGFSAVRLRLQYLGLLADPFLFAGLVLIAASAGLRQTRRGGTVFVITVGVVAAIGLFFLDDVVHALGIAETIPLTLAAWTPAGLSLLGGAAALLYLEDG